MPPTGHKLGPYEILSPLGRGGMGEVWRARDSRLGRDVAIKISDQQFSDRFEREARAIAALNHPNICTLHDVGPNYLVMEIVEGPTLAERIAKGPIQLDEALSIAGIDGTADHGTECWPLHRLARHIKTFVRQVAYARRETEAEQMTESEDVIREACGIGVVLFDPQLGLVIKQAVEHMRGIANGGVDDLGMEGRVLIGDVSVEGHARIIPIFRVHLARRFAASSRSIALAVGGRGCPFAPICSERNAVLMIDDFGQSF